MNHDLAEAPLDGHSKLRLARACPRTRDVLREILIAAPPRFSTDVFASPKPVSGKEDNPELGLSQRPQGI
jgi:hypothetical protein